MNLDFFDGQWVEVFRAGTQTSSSGYTKEWTEDDLNTIVKNYDSKKHEAPLVIGHPADNDPAYGWVEDLKTDGKILLAKFKQVANGMKEAVKDGLFKKRSISLYPDLSLRHIGFLGAVPPAVKGLADIKFNSEQEGIITIEFEEEKGDDNMSKELEEKIKGLEKGLEDQKKDFSDQLDALKAEKEKIQKQLDDEKAAKEKAEADYAEAKKELEGTKEPQKEELSEKEKEFQERVKNLEIELQKEKKSKRVAEFSSYVDGLHNEGKVATETKGMLVDLLEAAHQTGVSNFSDGEASVVGKFKEFLTKQPKIVEFGEIDPEKDKKANEESASEKLEKLTKDYLEKNKGISYSEALEVVQKENQDLATEVQKEILGN